MKIPPSITIVVPEKKHLTSEHIKEQFEYQRIDENLYHKAICCNEIIDQEESHINGTTDELMLCRSMLRIVFSKIPDHLQQQWKR